MSTVLPFANNTIEISTYEPFSYTISNPDPELYTLSTVKTAGLPASYLTTTNDSVIFETSSNSMLAGTQQFFITATGGNNSPISTNTVNISVGRFVDSNGNGFTGSNYTFYAKEAIPPIQMYAPFNIGTPTSIRTLPPGLGFSSVDGSSVRIIGTPLVTAPQSNYIIVGKDVGSGKTISSTIGIVISNERISNAVSPDSFISNMSIGTAITPRTFTAKGNGVIRYTWPSLPDGLFMTDINGIVQPYSPYGFSPKDPSYTMILRGTPTLTAATAFKNAGVTSNGVTQSILVERTDPLPLIASTIPIKFAFGEVVLFDDTTILPLYTGVTLDPFANYFKAATYFASSNVPITSITSPDLRPDLALAYNGNDRAYLTGTPLSAGSGTYTIRATNANGATRDFLVSITIVTDSVVFTPTPPVVDLSYTFVLSRPLDLSLSGYYPTPITFTAAADSKRTLSWTAAELAGTGLSLSATTGNSVTIVGTPNTVTPLKTLTLTATAAGTLATASQTVKFSVINDIFTFATVANPLPFIQNKPTTPIQFTATTKSGRQVTSYSASGLPAGFKLSFTGVLSGTPTVNTPGSFTITVSTGYDSGSQVFPYTIATDSILLIERPEPSYTLTPGGAMPPATVSGLSYSGINVSNFVFSNLPITYGMTIDSNTGVFGGTFTTSLPPDEVLPSNVDFYVNATAGAFTESLPVQLNTSNAARYQWFVAKGTYLAKTESNLSNWEYLTPGGTPLLSNIFTDYSIRPVTVASRVIVGVTNTTETAQSPDGTTFTVYPIPRTPWPFSIEPPSPGYTLDNGPNAIVSVPNTSTLYGVGYVPASIGTGGTTSSFWKSTNDGVSWTETFPLLATGIGGFSWLPNAFAYGSVIAYKNGVLLIAGYTADKSIIRSVDGGTTWSAVSGAPGSWWPSGLCTDADRWIYCGSSYYYPTLPWSGATDVRTLQYSDDQGQTWNFASSGDFNYFADFVVYGNGVWIAGGREGVGDTYAYAQFRVSTDGSTWTSFTINDVTIYPVPGEYQPEPIDMNYSTLLDAILFDGENFIILLRQRIYPANEIGTYDPYAYIHAADGSDLSSGWEQVSMGTLATIGDYTAAPNHLKGRFPVALAPLAPVLFFPNQEGGPTITYPTASSILLYQYVPMKPIVFTASGTGTIYFFVRESELPDGLTFNSLTNTLSGTPAQTGQTTITFYAKDDEGATTFTLSIRVILASITRQQDGAGAWTSLIRQYTEVNAATTARDRWVTPSNEYKLGEFTSPTPPSVITAASNCLC